MSEPLLTKRLHISGLTPSLTSADLEHRLSLFGKVKAIDGFGARDALGDPRKFGFVTMEIGRKELAKCLNVLSGSTWKGAKLRIGEAKPDFRERLAQTNSLPPQPVRQKRTRVRTCGRPSSTLPLTPLSATAAASTPGWIVTPSGRVVRPMRMRPERPLQPTRIELSASNMNGANGRVKKRVKPPPVRARRRLIDPTKWDSEYLKGAFLDAVSVPLLPSKESELPNGTENGIMDVEDEDEDISDDGLSSNVSQNGASLSKPAAQLDQDSHATPSFRQPSLTTSCDVTHPIDVRDEANATLAMLGKIFGDKEDWDERESVDELESLKRNDAREEEIQMDEQDDIEIVPRDFGLSERSKVAQKETGRSEEKSLGDAEMEGIDPRVETSSKSAESGPRTSLKDLFAPREEASFSLLDHLELGFDLELDSNIFGVHASSSALQENDRLPEQTLPTPHVAQVSATAPKTKASFRSTLDPSLPLLFPPVDVLPHTSTSTSSPTTTNRRSGTSSCFAFPETTRLSRLHHLPLSITFTRSPEDTSESIREVWEKEKSSLTHEWKKAWREARGSRRGRAGINGADVGGGY